MSSIAIISERWIWMAGTRWQPGARPGCNLGGHHLLVAGWDLRMGE